MIPNVSHVTQNSNANLINFSHILKSFNARSSSGKNVYHAYVIPEISPGLITLKFLEKYLLSDLNLDHLRKYIWYCFLCDMI